MKKMSYIAIAFILFLYTLSVSADEEGLEYEINPPDLTDLRLPDYTMMSEVYGVRPQYWNVRVIATNGYAYEFDKKGNVLSVDGKKQFADGRPVVGYLVELYSKYDNKPVWKGNETVYYWNSKPDNNKLLLNIIYGGARLVKDDVNVCPAQFVSGGYTLDIAYSYNDDTRLFLNGDCRKAINKKINGRFYKIYPPSKKIDTEGKNLYWTVQYFSDPITPVYNEHNKCVLYCDE